MMRSCIFRRSVPGVTYSSMLWHCCWHQSQTVVIRAKNTWGLRAISPQFSQNSPCGQILVYGKMHNEGYFLKILLKIAPVAKEVF